MKKLEINNNWWESDAGFFGASYLEADDSFVGHLNVDSGLSERTELEVNGIIGYCNLGDENSVMDCPCGYGRHSFGLASQELNVLGVDINEHFLSLGIEKKKKLNIDNLSFMKKDMRDIDFSNKFKAVINMFYSFGFFENEEDDILSIRNFYNSLEKGGKFLMHTHVTKDRLISGDLKNKQTRKLKSGNDLQLIRYYNKETKREDGEWKIVSRDGEVLESLTPYSMRIYSDKEFSEMCLSVGFSKVSVYGGWNYEEYTKDSPEMIIVAEK